MVMTGTFPIGKDQPRTHPLVRDLSAGVHVQIHKFMEDRGPPGPPHLPAPGLKVVLNAMGDQWAWRQAGRQDRGPQSPLPQAWEAASALSDAGPLTEDVDSKRGLVPDAVSSHDPDFHPAPGGPKRRLRCSWL